MSVFSRSKKEWMKERLDEMDANEHAQIFSIVRKYTDQGTRTQTGILISTEFMNDECLTEIDAYIQFLADQRKRMDEDTKARKTYERMVQ
jgi:hypothetical protein